jgi:hypothetical protein
VITELKKKIKYLIFFLSVFLISCSSSEESKGVTWTGPADFMHVTKEKMEMSYSVDVTGQKMYLGGFYEILKKGTKKVIFTIKATDLEFGTREDGVFFCRVWGPVDDSTIESYLLAQECLPIKVDN